MQLTKRLSALEQVSTAVPQISAIIITPLGCDELNHIHDSNGNEWSRLPGEAQEAFRDRAAPKRDGEKQRIALLVGR